MLVLCMSSFAHLREVPMRNPIELKKTVARKEPKRAVETLSVRLAEPFLSDVWLPLKEQLPFLSASDLVKQGLQARAAMEAADESGEPVSVRLFHSGAPNGEDFATFLGFKEASERPAGRRHVGRPPKKRKAPRADD
jgi:hypothetical protein